MCVDSKWTMKFVGFCLEVCMGAYSDARAIFLPPTVLTCKLQSLAPLGRRMATADLAFFARPSSSAVRIVAPSNGHDPSPSPKPSPKKGACFNSTCTRGADGRVYSRRTDSIAQRPCRNIVIYGYALASGLQHIRILISSPDRVNLRIKAVSITTLQCVLVSESFPY